MPWTILIVSGLGAGLLAGLLGIGGGTVLFPILLALGYSPLQAVSTSSLAIVITASSGSFQNWRMGFVDRDRILMMGIPALIAAQLGVLLSEQLPDRWLLIGFGLMMLFNIYLTSLLQQLIRPPSDPGSSYGPKPQTKLAAAVARILTGCLAGGIAGLLGIGGGAIMVPLQMLLLQEPIKRAIQTSLGVVVLTALSSTLGHGLQGNVQWLAGLILGGGGLLGVQGSTRLLPGLPDALVGKLFRLFFAAVGCL